jgi:two-component system chemotaxis response regulator CheY
MSEAEVLEWVSGKKIVVVEDDATSRMLLDGLIRSLGATSVHTAVDGEDAMRLIETKGVPDIIFCDWMMPHMDGLTLLSVVKELHPSVLFVMVTSKREADDVRSAAQLKVDGYILKPYTRQTLIASVERLRAKSLEE